jgi:hypothetical protein
MVACFTGYSDASATGETGFQLFSARWKCIYDDGHPVPGAHPFALRPLPTHAQARIPVWFALRRCLELLSNP